MSIEDKKQDVIKRLSYFDSWEERYKQILHFGKKLPPMDESLKTEDRLVKGCLSRVWLAPEMIEGRLHFHADSDAAITKGIIALLLKVYSGETPADIVELDASFLEQVGITDHLSMNRRNGLVNMLGMIKLYAGQELK